MSTLKWTVFILVFSVFAVVLPSCDESADDEVILSGPWDFYHLKLERYAGQKSIYFLTADSGWAVSSQYVLFYDGNAWGLAADFSIVPGFERPAHLECLDFNNPIDGWAVGYTHDFDKHDGLIFHYDGSEWKYAATAKDTRLSAVDALAPNNVWAVGEGGIWHYDGSGWTLADDVGATLFGVHFRTPDDGWAVGDNAAYYHYNGVQWQGVYADEFENRRDVFFTAADKGWGVGGASSVFPEAPVTHPLMAYENGFWVPKMNSTASLEGIHFSSPSDGWAVGAKIWRYDGSSWREVPPPGNLFAYDVFTLGGDDVWLACDHGYICKYNPNKE